MIASLKGKVEALYSDAVVINVGGVGFHVFIPASALGAVGGTGGEVKLYTHLNVREDNLSLFGFLTPEDLGLFHTLINVTGLGPKLALAMLGAMDVEKLAAAIATGNLAVLTSISGIGKKMAERIILELKDKVSTGMLTLPPAASRDNAEVLAALVSLGYSTTEANEAVASLPLDSDADLEDKIRLALAYFTYKS
jgi:holliday junction DNA helicase RuvA